MLSVNMVTAVAAERCGPTIKNGPSLGMTDTRRYGCAASHFFRMLILLRWHRPEAVQNSDTQTRFPVFGTPIGAMPRRALASVRRSNIANDRFK